MKRIAVIDVAFPPDALDARMDWEPVIERYATNPKWIEPFRFMGPLYREGSRSSVYCEVDADSPKYEAFISVLKEHGLELPRDYDAPDHEAKFDAVLHSKGMYWQVLRIEHRYTDAELRSFPLLSLAVTVDMENHGLEFGTTYDLSKGCPQCGIGAVQTSPLLLPLKRLPKKGLLCATRAGDVLVAERLADALRSAGMYGWELRQVLLHGNKEPLPWWQMISPYEMPKLSTASKGIACDPKVPLCPKCKRNARCSVGIDPVDIVYDRRQVDADELPDVVCAWERSGVSRIDREDFKKSFIPRAPLLVKPKVFDVFRRLKVKAAEFFPVRIE